MVSICAGVERLPAERHRRLRARNQPEQETLRWIAGDDRRAALAAFANVFDVRERQSAGFRLVVVARLALRSQQSLHVRSDAATGGEQRDCQANAHDRIILPIRGEWSPSARCTIKRSEVHHEQTLLSRSLARCRRSLARCDQTHRFVPHQRHYRRDLPLAGRIDRVRP